MTGVEAKAYVTVCMCSKAFICTYYRLAHELFSIGYDLKYHVL